MELYPKFYDFASKTKEIHYGEQLVTAAGMGDIAQIKHLLNIGVPINADEYISSLFYDFKNYMTPLQVACDKNQHEAVKLLIEAGAEINVMDRFGQTAVHIAAVKGHILCLRELLDAGAECSVPIKELKNGCSLPTLRPGYLCDGWTPLHLATASIKIDCVIELIQAGADYNAVDKKGRTSLYIAAEFGLKECLLAHLKNANGRNILSLPSLESQNTPLHFAVQYGMIECVEELLKFGSNPNHLNCLGSSPLHYAVSADPDLEGSSEASSEAILKLLVLNGYNIDVNQPDKFDYTPLHYVCFNSGGLFVRRPNLACFLIAYGANPLIKNQRGYNIIECEINESHGDQRILKAMIQSVLHLPSLQSLNLNIPPPPLPSTDPEIFLISMEQDVDPEQNDEQEFWAIEHEQMFNIPTNTSQVHHGVIEEKYRWYESIVSQPRTLQHYCRYRIRASLGYRRLGHIKDLPIALPLQDYLLLKTEQF